MLMALEPGLIGRRVKDLREAAKMTQQDLAVKAGLNAGVLASIEQGKTNDPRASTLRALAKALGVSIDRLAGEEP
jgi:transcriptional regulator with XRE-family HTH domain